MQKALKITLDYIPWSLDVVYRIAPNFDCVVLPNAMNRFSKGKSANRTFLSLSLGLPVVATRTSELEKLNHCVLFDDWVSSIEKYGDKSDEGLKRAHLEAFNSKYTGSVHYPKNVWLRWESTFESLAPAK